ncbi:hypothetical protein EMIT048CA2_140113 [Pseudomonas chlororaphis]
MSCRYRYCFGGLQKDARTYSGPQHSLGLFRIWSFDMALTTLPVVAASTAAGAACGRGDLAGWPAVIFLAAAGVVILFGIGALIHIEWLKRR